MGNKKNKYNHYNSHRHVFKRRRRPEKYRPKAKLSQKVVTQKLEGSRIVNMEKLQESISILTAHAAKCGPDIVLEGEKKDGLASIISAKCLKCRKIFCLQTSQKIKGPNGYQRWECNLAAVWGQMCTGGGHTKLQGSMATLGIPVMSKNSFTTTEQGIGQWWKQQLELSMIEAGREEKRLAEERGDYHEGVPAITVIVDGGWSKRSHRHSYNAKSGVAIVIGSETKKILHIGVRNKYCTACTQGIPKEKHKCFKNWEESSSQMEPDILLEAFQQAERVHGVRYMRFIGDGDSSVHSTLIQGVAGWGRHIKKLECANHACKCYRSALEKIVSANPAYKGKGGLTQKMRQRLTSAARCAIKMRSNEPDRKKAVKLLEQDLKNGPYHCFGHHENCSPDFCLTVRNGSNAQSHSNNTVDQTEQTGTNEELNDVLLQQEVLWNETLRDDPITERDALTGGNHGHQLNPQLMHEIQVAVSRLVGKAGQLIYNFTTNLAENWMHVRCKFDGGKVVNRSQSGSWEHRCHGAGLEHNLGKEWGPKVWEQATKSPPNQVFSNVATASAKITARDRKRKAEDHSKESRRRNKYSKTDSSTAACRAYRQHNSEIEPEEVTDDVSPEYLESLKQSFYNTKVKVSSQDALIIECNTRQQSENEDWMKERVKRITASRVGGIAKMRKTTKRSKKVESLLYSTFRGNEATRYGQEMEEQTRNEYEVHQKQNGHEGLKTQSVGLVISLENPWLAASPDNRVDDPHGTPRAGLAEYKNPFAARDVSLSEACTKPTFCLKMNKIGEKLTFQLKRQHDYYYQVQCQLYCCDLEWCDFVVRTEKELHVERIYRDRKWWASQLEKLREFYFNSLLPELACPRKGKGGIR